VSLVTSGGACAEDPLPSTCPEPAPASLSSCTELGLSCTYPDGPSCLCSDCNPNAPSCQPAAPQWFCTGNTDPNCPGIAPNAGAACSPAGTTCNYTCDLVTTCGEDGYWQWDRFNCPDCASPDTPVATPLGERPIASLRAGDEVYTVHRGELVVAPIAQVSSRPVSRHHVMRVVLETGAVLEISAGHPTAEGGAFGELRRGMRQGGVAIASAELVPYRHGRTHDILPESDSGAYFAAGMLVGSTLRREGSRVTRVAPECR
jgi:hypothetical protein